MKASLLLMNIGAMFGAPIALELIPQDKYPIAYHGCITVMVVLVLAGIFRFGTEFFGPPDS